MTEVSRKDGRRWWRQESGLQILWPNITPEINIFPEGFTTRDEGGVTWCEWTNRVPVWMTTVN